MFNCIGRRCWYFDSLRMLCLPLPLLPFFSISSPNQLVIFLCSFLSLSVRTYVSSFFLYFFFLSLSLWNCLSYFVSVLRYTCGISFLDNPFYLSVPSKFLFVLLFIYLQKYCLQIFLSICLSFGSMHCQLLFPSLCLSICVTFFHFVSLSVV